MRFGLALLLVALWNQNSIARADQSICPQSSPEIKNTLDLARMSADQLTDQYIRAGLLHETAKLYARNADFQSAQEVIGTDSALMWQASDVLARNVLRCGQVAELEVIAAKDAGRSRSLSLQWLAEWYAKHGNQAESDATLSKIKDADIRHEAEFNITAQKLIKQGFKEADSTLRKVLATSANGSSSMDDVVAENLAIIYALNGDIDKAITHLSQVKGREKIYAFYSVAGAIDAEKHADAIGSFSKAALTATKLSLNEPEQAYPLSLVATALARLAMYDDAIELAKSLPNEQRKTEAMVMIAVRLIEDKQPGKADSILGGLSTTRKADALLESTRLNGWYRIAIAQANSSDGQAALRTLALFDRPSSKNSVSLQRSFSYAKMERFAEASALAASIPQEDPSDERGRAYRLLAAVLTNKKGLSNARTWAKALASAQDRTSAYLGIVDGLFGLAKEEVPLYFED